MPNHLRRSATALLLVLLGAGGARAADFREQAETGGPLRLQERSMFVEERFGAWGRPPRPHGRPVNGGPGYVGSDYGLGKPAFTGLGSRPDWGLGE